MEDGDAAETRGEDEGSRMWDGEGGLVHGMGRGRGCGMEREDAEWGYEDAAYRQGMGWD